MKFQKLLLIVGLALSMNLVAMDPNTFTIDYSDDSGSDTDTDVSPTASVLPATKPAPTQLVLPLRKGVEYADEPTFKRSYWGRPTNTPITPVQTVLNPSDYDKPGVQSVGLASYREDKPLESAIEYADRPRAYPALPKGLFITPPSTKEFDEPLARKKILADEPTLAKQPPVYADKPAVSQTRKTDIEPMGILKPQAPIVEPKRALLPVIAATLLQQKHAAFEVAITNNTSDVFNVVYNNERQIINPNETATVIIDKLQSKTSQAVKTTFSSGVQTSRQVIPITTDSATINLVRKSDQQAYNIILGQRAGPKNMTTAVTLQKDERVSKKTLKNASITSEFARKGFSVYFPINITLKGNDLTESTIQATPTEE
jgi:hypothetical protein